MRVLNVNSSLDSRTGGGTAERTFQMSRFLARSGKECTVLTVDTGLDKARIAALAPANVVALPLLWRRFYVPYTKWHMIKMLVADADIIHLMGHWGVLNAIVYMIARRMGKPYVVCPAGALPIFGRSTFIKHLYNLLVGNAIIRNASAWVAVTPIEFSQFESYGIPASKITVIPNGVAAEDFPAMDTVDFRAQKNLSDKPLILFMGRLNLIKGPDILLRAFASIKYKIGEHHLVFVGPDEGMQAGLLEFAHQQAISDRVHFLGFAGGQDKVAAYRSASLLVVPSRQEAMSIVALEAGICGIPALVTDQCGFGEIKSISPALETTADVQGVARSLQKVITEPDMLKNLGPLFYEFVVQRYTWESIVAAYAGLYTNILALKK
jgi:glycosyltransferase involved in cell wall biosynthesis